MKGKRLGTIGRRLITISGIIVGLVLVLTVFPLLLALALIVDLIKRSRFATLRLTVLLAIYLACETLGIVASFALWVMEGGPFGRRTGASLDRHYGLQRWWSAALFACAKRIYRFRLIVEGEKEAGPGRGPILLFVRHVSIGDTLLPSALVSNRYGLRLRYVLKEELLWDPCLDIVGNRLPNVFVRRGTGGSTAVVESMIRLVDGLGPRDGVLIYPEGTRFTRAKRERILARLREVGDREHCGRSEALKNVLPPRLGGPLALLEENERADVVFLAHVGFERMTRFEHLLKGSLIDADVHVCFWREPFASIPDTREGRIDWLYRHWARVDAWVGEKMEGATH